MELLGLLLILGSLLFEGILIWSLYTIIMFIVSGASSFNVGSIVMGMILLYMFGGLVIAAIIIMAVVIIGLIVSWFFLGDNKKRTIKKKQENTTKNTGKPTEKK